MSFGEKLSELLRNRLTSPELQQQIDLKIWQDYGQEVTIVITDLTRCTAITKKKGIIHFISLIQRYRDVVNPLIKQYAGILVKMEGDSLFLVFASPVDAVRFAMDSRTACDEYNKNIQEDSMLNLSQGIACGKVLLPPGDLFGDAVNVASKLGEDTAEKREIFISEEVFQQVETELPGEVFLRQKVRLSGMMLSYYSIK